MNLINNKNRTTKRITVFLSMPCILLCITLLFSTASYSLDLWDPMDRMMLEGIVEDAILDSQMYNLPVPPSYGYVPENKPQRVSKKFGKSTDGVDFSIYLETITVDKSGRGIGFVVASVSEFPRYENKVAYFGNATKYIIDCDSKEISAKARMFFNADNSQILLDPKGKTNKEKYVVKYNLNFRKISNDKNTFENMYMKFICR